MVRIHRKKTLRQNCTFFHILELCVITPRLNILTSKTDIHYLPLLPMYYYFYWLLCFEKTGSSQTTTFFASIYPPQYKKKIKKIITTLQQALHFVHGVNQFLCRNKYWHLYQPKYYILCLFSFVFWQQLIDQIGRRQILSIMFTKYLSRKVIIRWNLSDNEVSLSDGGVWQPDHSLSTRGYAYEVR